MTVPKRLIYCFDGGHRMTGLKDFGAEHVLRSRRGFVGLLAPPPPPQQQQQHWNFQVPATCQRTRVLPGNVTQST